MLVNEIFYSLQGEGYYSGTPAVFIRLSGCNLQCPFCDTHHAGYVEYTELETVAMTGFYDCHHIVVTGGEPSLQLTPTFVDALHSVGHYVAVETNGTCPLPPNVDWVTLSPKDLFLGPAAAPVLERADELKLLFDGVHEPSLYPHIQVAHRYLQPCDTGDPVRNADLVRQAVDYCMAHPEWRLSLQMHKILNIR